MPPGGRLNNINVSNCDTMLACIEMHQAGDVHVEPVVLALTVPAQMCPTQWIVAWGKSIVRQQICRFCR
jgi:hypothetical protein